MFIAYVVLGSVLAFVVLGSGLAMLNGVPQVRQVLEHVGAWGIARPLGYLLIAAAVGLVVGIWLAPIGIAAATGLCLYFLGAVIAHIRVGDPVSQWANPAVPLLLSALTLWFRVASA